ncbi:precorrin-6A/cobalt-precorrin-6A reductase [Desulfosporosinus youngiae]|uniref:Precorrin-6x reductase n=1 Tax=Desulfosporosinus youngiae DSM 17734 TaxID=768710 RepID=H5XY88_9FIRM|nr:precorrin-6A/cobalt-precorrin-6A reductase [Desulfosporosinus youngiae]EHQ91298.1 precorrin-6x reductase [Desulfosporosinus youngiae DSM 17734]
MILLLGETAAAREISEYLNSRRYELTRMQTWSEKASLHLPSLVIDASPPSSSVKFAHLRQWCEEQDIPYLRLERPETIVPVSPLIYSVNNWEEALIQLEDRVGTLYQEKGRLVTVFVTTGSHQLESIVRSPFARLARIVVRVLPEGRLVQKCQNMGISPRNIIAMQGQFSKEVNKVSLKFYGADILLTRDSGSAGGTDTKVSAALELGIEIIFIKRNNPHTGLTVYSVHELFDWVDANIPAPKCT